MTESSRVTNAWKKHISDEEMQRQRTDAEKVELLLRFCELEECGVLVVKRFTMKSDLQEMLCEYKKLSDQRSRGTTVFENQALNRQAVANAAKTSPTQ